MSQPPSSRSEDAYLLGLDLGGTRLKALAISPEGREIARQTARTDGSNWQDEVRACVQGVLARHGPPLRMGVAAPGLAATDGRSIAYLPDRLLGLQGLDWTSFLAATSTVPVLNDAHAALLGEIWRGAVEGQRDVILLTLGTGVGGAILSDGRLLRGRLGRAGHLGHITLDSDGALDMVNTPGSLEDAIGNHSLVRRSAGRYESTATLLEDVARGHPPAIEIWTASIRKLAAGVASLVNALDPETVLLGGGIAEAGEELLRPLSRELDRFEWRPGGQRVRLLRTALGDWAGAYGAAYHSINS